MPGGGGALIYISVHMCEQTNKCLKGGLFYSRTRNAPFAFDGWKALIFKEKGYFEKGKCRGSN